MTTQNTTGKIDGIRNTIRAVVGMATGTGKGAELDVRACLLQCADEIAARNKIVSPFRQLEALGVSASATTDTDGETVFVLMREGCEVGRFVI